MGYRAGEIEGVRMIQAHQRRIHPHTPNAFHYEDSALSLLQTGLQQMLMASQGQACADGSAQCIFLIKITESLFQLCVPSISGCT